MAKNNKNKTREIWFDGRNIPLEKTDIWSYVNNSAIHKVLVSIEQRQKGHYPLKTEFITHIGSVDDFGILKEHDMVLSDDSELLENAKNKGYRTCIFMRITDRGKLENSWYEALKHDFILVDFDLPTNIPLELIIARLQQSNTVILKRVTGFEDMEVVFGVMEQGSDGVLLDTADISELVKINSFLSREGGDRIELLPLKVKKTSHIGMGMRACIDTTGLMGRDEGMLVGSTSTGGIFVCSETHYLPYMNLRPFRVNAGAIHSYVWVPDNMTEYITDLSVGSRILCVNIKGETRILTVGRIKTEMRPLLLISGKTCGQNLNVIVQDDWHIRIMGADGKPKNATSIKPGDKLLSYLCKPGRHVGIKVDETILEV